VSTHGFSHDLYALFAFVVPCSLFFFKPLQHVMLLLGEPPHALRTLGILSRVKHGILVWKVITFIIFVSEHGCGQSHSTNGGTNFEHRFKQEFVTQPVHVLGGLVC
jgi:hypothetical protein